MNARVVLNCVVWGQRKWCGPRGEMLASNCTSQLNVSYWTEASRAGACGSNLELKHHVLCEPVFPPDLNSSENPKGQKHGWQRATLTPCERHKQVLPGEHIFLPWEELRKKGCWPSRSQCLPSSHLGHSDNYTGSYKGITVGVQYPSKSEVIHISFPPY